MSERGLQRTTVPLLGALESSLMYDPLVFTSRQVLMQRIGDQVRVGYRHWTSGEVELGRASALVRKFARLYAVDLDRNRRLRAKARGEGNATLMLARFDTESTRLLWYLLVTAGDNPAHTLEQLRDAGTVVGRMHHAGYELVHVTKRGVDHPVLTWRMSGQNDKSWRTRAIAEARSGNPHRVQLFLRSLYRSPGFSGIRKQVGKIVALFRREWARRHGTKAPHALPRLYYCARLRNRGMRLSHMLREANSATAGFTSPERADVELGDFAETA